MARLSPVVDTQTALTGNGNSALINAPEGGVAPKVGIFIDVTAVGTAPTLDITIEHSLDGTNFEADEADAQSFIQITAIGRAFKVFDVKGSKYRLVYAVGGTTPSYDFTVRQVGIG